MKTKIEIEYDSDAKTAAITVGSGKQTLWRDAELSLTRDITEHEIDGWVRCEAGDAHFSFTARLPLEVVA